MTFEGRERPGVGFTGLILAAGDSKRMGQPKASLPIHGQPAAIRLARACLGAGAGTAIMLVSDDVYDAVQEKLPLGAEGNRRMQVLVVPERLRSRGPIGSIRHGIVSSGRAKGWVLWPVDHPFVEVATIRRLVGEGEKPIRLPRHEGRRGHPIFLDASCRDGLLETIEHGGTLRDFVRSRLEDVEDLEVGDPAIHWNCNSPAAFRTWLEEYELRHSQNRG